jgi:hypothetical protein
MAAWFRQRKERLMTLEKAKTSVAFQRGDSRATMFGHHAAEREIFERRRTQLRAGRRVLIAWPEHCRIAAQRAWQDL